jgi:hypothetical protein
MSNDVKCFHDFAETSSAMQQEIHQYLQPSGVQNSRNALLPPLSLAHYTPCLYHWLTHVQLQITAIVRLTFFSYDKDQEDERKKEKKKERKLYNPNRHKLRTCPRKGQGRLGLLMHNEMI